MLDGFKRLDLMMNGLGEQAEHFTHGEYLKDAVEHTYVFWIKRMAVAAGLPREFVDGVKARVEGNDVIVYNDWTGPFGEPLATFFNNGTKPHEIRPKVEHPQGGHALPGRSHEQIDPPDKKVQHPRALHWKKGGFNFFAKSVWNPGLASTRVFEAGREEARPFIKEYLKTQIAEKFHWLKHGDELVKHG